MEIQTNSNERHEVETNCAEKESDALVDESHNMEGPMSIFSWVLVSKFRDFELDGIATGDSVIDEWTVVKAWNIYDCSERHIFVDDTQDVSHAWQNNHNIDFDNQTYDGSEQAQEEWWITIREVIVMVYNVFHHRDSCSHILFDINVHESRGNESCYHHIESFDRPDGESLIGLSILPNTQNHDDLN